MEQITEKPVMLIVDDVEINRVVLTQFFQEEYLIIEAENGQEALNVIEKQPVSIMLMDLVMPVMDGFELLSILKRNQRYAELPVIVMTAHSDGDSEARAMEMGAADFITKPYHPIIVRCRVKNVMARLENEWRKIEEAAKDSHLQDALSLRCIPQLHGAAKKTLYDAKRTIETEMNSCCDNPIIWSETGEEDVISACNADSSYVGLEMDSCAIAATMLAKMSERRNNRLIDETYSDYPSFMIKNPGLNSGLMIPQYTQAGLINSMRIQSHPATVDNTPTCVNQEDYVAMGYNAAKKAYDISEKLEFVLAIELLSNYEAQTFANEKTPVASVSKKIYDRIAKDIPLMTTDEYLYPHIEILRNLIHNGELLRIVEESIGKLS